MSLNLVDTLDEQTPESDNDPTSSADYELVRRQESGDSLSSDDDDDMIPLLARAKDSCGYNLGKARMLACMIEQVKAQSNIIQRRIANARRTAHNQRQEELRALGVDEDLLEMLSTEPRSSIPTLLRRDISQKRALNQKRNGSSNYSKLLGCTAKS
jgi:hypothetical protein